MYLQNKIKLKQSESNKIDIQIQEFLNQGGKITCIETPEYDYSEYNPIRLSIEEI